MTQPRSHSAAPAGIQAPEDLGMVRDLTDASSPTFPFAVLAVAARERS